MADHQSRRREAIESLLAERKKFEAWLTQLDDKRASTAEHVFARVHADYTQRLDAVRERLGAEADGIRSLVGELESRLATQQTAVTEKTDERAELELRAAVGEFSEREWNNTRSKLDAAIGDLRTKFDGTERELAEMKDTLDSVLNAPKTPAEPAATVEAPVPAVDPVVEAELAPAAEPLGEPADEPAVEPTAEAASTAHVAEAAKAAQPFVAKAAPRKQEPAPARKPTPFDELAFLKSVAGTPVTPVTSQPAKGAPAKATKPAPKPPEPEPEPEPEVEEVAVEPAAVEPFAMESVVEMPVEAAEGAPGPEPEPPFATFEPPMETEDEDSESLRERSRPSSKTPFETSSLGAPTPRTSQAIRSLKCQECGTLNFPTEWYCERCGGELAAF